MGNILEDVENFKKNELYDMVGGAIKESQAGIHRSIANGLYNLFTSYVTGRRIEDLTGVSCYENRYHGFVVITQLYPTTMPMHVASWL